MIKTLSKSRKASVLNLPSKNFRAVALTAGFAAVKAVTSAVALAPAVVSPITLPASNKSVWLVPSPNTELKLETNEAHIWAASLKAENVSFLERLLSADEQARAARFHFEKDRRRYIVARATLRRLLGEYLGVTTSEIRFDYGEFGKPFVPGQKEIEFNLSHSGDFAVYAFSRQREIGVDIEEINPAAIDQAMLDQTLTGQEKTFYYTLSVEKRDTFFFECWTRKESFMKACGMGLTLLPNEIETLSFTNVSDTKSGTGFRSAGWSTQTIPFVPAGVTAALTIKGDYSPRLRFWQR